MESQSDLDIQWLETLLKQNFHNKKPMNIIKVDVESAVPKGDNYTSTVLRAKMRVITADGSKKTISMIVKVPVNSKETKDVVEGLFAFRGEIKMFTTILKQMEALMDEFDDKRDTLWARLYGYKPYKTMVLEDLKARNFTLIDRTKWQSLDHGLLVLRSVGRYHAMGKILMQRGLIGANDKGHFLLGKNTPFKCKIIDGSLHMLSQAMINHAGHWPSGWEDLGKRLEKQKNVLCDTMLELYETDDKKFEVFNHGDLWSSNMMFREMEYTGIPTQVVFVDYQLPHMGSFMWDVTYFMYTSVIPSVRRAHKDQLLRAYHESLSDNLKFFQWQGYTPTLDDVMKEADRLLPAALGFLIGIFPITSATTENAFFLDKLLTHPPEEYFNAEVFCEEKFVRQVADDFKIFATLGII